MTTPAALSADLTKLDREELGELAMSIIGGMSTTRAEWEVASARALVALRRSAAADRKADEAWRAYMATNDAAAAAGGKSLRALNKLSQARATAHGAFLALDTSAKRARTIAEQRRVEADSAWATWMGAAR